MTLGEALRQTSEQFRAACIPDARLEAEHLVAAVGRIPRLRLALDDARELTLDQEKCLGRWVQDRLARKPLAYLLGEQPFMDLLLEVNPSVLIPRPETELLVEAAQRVLNDMCDASVVDVGTGSGNIVLSLAQHSQVQQLFAVDISPDALEVAQKNALRNHIDKPVQWILGDLLTPLIERGTRVDLIVANLPYVRGHELSQLSPEVRWEPVLALDGGRNGLSYIASLASQAEKVLKPGGVLLLEIGAGQRRDVLSLLDQAGVWKNVGVSNDYAGHSRIIYAQRGARIGSFND